MPRFNLRIAGRLVAAIAIPLTIFAFFAGYDLLRTWQVRSEMAELNDMVQGVTKLSRLAHHLQRERGLSAVVIGSTGVQGRAEVSAQRRLTEDQRAGASVFLAKLELMATGELKTAISGVNAAFGQLDDKRKGVDNLSITAQQSFAYFTDTIARLFVIAGQIAKISSRVETSVAVSAYLSLIQGKEFAAQERGLGAGGVSKGKFDTAGYFRMLALRAVQDTHFGIFVGAATPAQRDFFQRTLAGDVAETVERMRDIIAAERNPGGLQGLDSKSWFEATTARIDQIKAVEDRVAADLAVLAAGIYSEANSSLLENAGIVAAAFLITLVFAFLVSRSITRPLHALTASMKHLAAGNFNIVIAGTDRRDEVGEIAGAVEVFKVVAAKKAQREAEEKAEQARQVEAEREAAAQRMATEFEAAVGGLVRAAVVGDFSQRVDLSGKTGLVLNVGRALNSLCENVSKALDDLLGILSALAEGDLTRRITAQYDGNFAILKDRANQTAEQVGKTLSEIRASAHEVASASAEISTSTTDLSQRTEQQAASLEQTSASMEEISATVKKNADNAQLANQSAAMTRDVANRGGQVVGEAVAAMTRIEESSRRIADIIGVIDEIARQTNLLALNAAVEAARAGDAGRGFAVVAAEVRSLAQRASQAAKDIKDLISNSSSQVREGVDLVNKAGASLSEIVVAIENVVAVVADIAAANAEQSSGIDQVNRALSQMDEVTQRNSALVEENAATARTLEDQARLMDDRVAYFRLHTASGNDIVHDSIAAASLHEAAPSTRRQARA